MIQITPQMRVFVAVEPVDFRRGIDGLARTCRAELGADPFSGAVFVFRNRRRTALRVLVYDGQGFWLCYKPRSSSRNKREHREVKREDLEAILARAENALSRDDHETLRAAIETLIFLTDEIEAKGATIRRLRRLIFGASTEKTNKVVGEQADSGGEGDGTSDADASTGEAAAGEAASDEATDDEGAKKKRKGHGRRSASEYEGAEKIDVPHESLKPGDRCPACGRGKVRRLDPAVFVRVMSMAPLSATVAQCERLRCSLCGEVFTAKAPEGFGGEKYDEPAAAMIGLLKYGTGMPFNRLERLEGSLGIPLPASTQWEVVERAAKPMMPAYGRRNGPFRHTDVAAAPVLIDRISDVAERCRESRCRES